MVAVPTVAMSRNKENIPFTSPQWSNGAAVPTSKNIPSDEFFTDSLLDATRISSRIPTPSPQKPSLAKARRARTSKPARNTQHSIHRSSTSESTLTRAQQKDYRPATPLRDNYPPPRLRTGSLSSPVHLDGDFPQASPYSSISSPPPQDITDAYQQIKDAEDLAQTEHEFSSGEGSVSESEQALPVRLHQRSYSESPVRVQPLFTGISPASTPTRSTIGLNRARRFGDQTETLSEASGLSFLKDLTDQKLAGVLTPHMSERARDKARLDLVWGNKEIKPFSKAQIPWRDRTRPEPFEPGHKQTAFSRASRVPQNGVPNGSYLNGQSDGLAVHRDDTQGSSSSNDIGLTSSRPHKRFSPNPKIERNFNFSRNFGFPPPRPALTEQNLQQQNKGNSNVTPKLHSQFSVPSLLSAQSENNAKVLRENMRAPSGDVSPSPQIRKPAAVGKVAVADETSQVDWAAAAADVPIPSVESSFASEKQKPTPSFRAHSPEKSRRWDNDFTGQSFLVSESPPVRQWPPRAGTTRDKEIEGVAKHAVASNRLSEIRERQSQESLRAAAKSSAPQPARLSDSRARSLPPTEDDSSLVGTPVPDTPVVIYRSTSNGENGTVSTTPPVERPIVDRSKSHDHLQRLARAMSTTPRSSPASDNISTEDHMSKPLAKVKEKEEITPSTMAEASVSSGNTNPKSGSVAQTPKVVGAWTDTILPDTVRPIKHLDKQASVAQTPHVSAGGWIDTPAPVEQKKYSVTIPTIVEEVPEELTSGFVKSTNSSDTIKVQASKGTSMENPAEAQLPTVEQPKSALVSILDQQRNRLVSQDIATASREDTLDLGDDTMQSLQNFLHLDEDDLTTLSQLYYAKDSTGMISYEDEAALLQRIGVKLDRVRSNIHVARKGISKLEHQVSQPTLTTTTPQSLLSETLCSVCNQQTFEPHSHAETPRSKRFPHASFTFSLPIPLLFHPRKHNQLIPRPTFLGKLTLSIWAWYLIETIMCELYCRPEYTDFYVWPTEPEPEFPFVLPTMIGRWTGLRHFAPTTLITGLWNFLVRIITAMWRVIGMAGGWSDGFVDGESDQNAGTTVAKVIEKVVKTVTEASAAQATGVDLGMNDDEYI